jgi:cysteine desulfurase
MTDEVIFEMLPYMKQQYGNPSSIHKFGREATRAMQLARKRVAELIGASAREIIFTSGGTEADNLALRGAAMHIRNNYPEKTRIITSSIEHDAILETCRDLERNGFSVSYLPVTTEGLVRLQDLKNTISSKDVALVSIMYANNEVGTIQPVEELAEITHQANVLFHTDAVQAVGKIPINVKNHHIDMMSISSHKINGPKGIGALYIRKDVNIDPIIYGGGQESSLRSGTENVPGIVGFGKACELAFKNIDQYHKKVSEVRDHLIEKILSEIPYSRLNGSRKNRIPNNAHFTFFGVNGEDLIIKLDENGIAASTGSACAVKKQKPSHVLKAMGFAYEEITGSLRLSIGMHNTNEEMNRTVNILLNVIEELRALSPFKSKYA